MIPMELELGHRALSCPQSSCKTMQNYDIHKKIKTQHGSHEPSLNRNGHVVSYSRFPLGLTDPATKINVTSFFLFSIILFHSQNKYISWAKSSLGAYNQLQQTFRVTHQSAWLPEACSQNSFSNYDHCLFMTTGITDIKFILFHIGHNFPMPCK